MSGAFRRLLFIQIKKRIGSQSFCLLYSSGKKKYVADRAKTLLINIKCSDERRRTKVNLNSAKEKPKNSDPDGFRLSTEDYWTVTL